MCSVTSLSAFSARAWHCVHKRMVLKIFVSPGFSSFWHDMHFMRDAPRPFYHESERAGVVRPAGIVVAVELGGISGTNDLHLVDPVPLHHPLRLNERVASGGGVLGLVRVSLLLPAPVADALHRRAEDRVLEEVERGVRGRLGRMIGTQGVRVHRLVVRLLHGGEPRLIGLSVVGSDVLQDDRYESLDMNVVRIEAITSIRDGDRASVGRGHASPMPPSWGPPSSSSCGLCDLCTCAPSPWAPLHRPRNRRHVRG